MTLQTSQFYALDDSDTEVGKHFPLNIIFDSVKFRRATVDLPQDMQTRADNLQKRFQQAQFPYYMVETEETDKIAIVFERINRKGVPLDTFQLLTAWTWSEEFELKQQFEELAGELESFGFSDVGEDTELILRCAAAVLIGKESAESLLSVTGATVRDVLPMVKKGLKASLDFLKQNLHIHKLDNLPYPTALIPLTAFFAGPDEEQLSLTEFSIVLSSSGFGGPCFRTAIAAGQSAISKRTFAKQRNYAATAVATSGRSRLRLPRLCFPKGVFSRAVSTLRPSCSCW